MLLASHAFGSQHPSARGIRVAVNLEASGSRGGSYLLQVRLWFLLFSCDVCCAFRLLVLLCPININFKIFTGLYIHCASPKQSVRCLNYVTHPLGHMHARMHACTRPKETHCTYTYKSMHAREGMHRCCCSRDVFCERGSRVVVFWSGCVCVFDAN